MFTTVNNNSKYEDCRQVGSSKVGASVVLYCICARKLTSCLLIQLLLNHLPGRFPQDQIHSAEVQMLKPD